MPLVSVATLIEKVQQGQVVSFPTDTVPALAALPEYCDRIFSLKGRPSYKPLILMGASWDQFEPYLTLDAICWDACQRLISHYWPGALTLVLPASARVPPSLNPNQDGTLGVRIPNAPIAVEILRATGPLGTTSANLAGASPLLSATAIAETFGEVYILDDRVRETPEGQENQPPSTVLQWTDNGWLVRRQGAIVVSESSHT